MKKTYKVLVIFIGKYEKSLTRGGRGIENIVLDEGGEDEGSDNEDVLPVHLNPYLDQTQLGPDNFLQEFSKSMKALSKTTSTDIENKVDCNIPSHIRL